MYADMLDTLSLFAVEPGKWVMRFEWMEGGGLVDLEMCALRTVWKHLGRRWVRGMMSWKLDGFDEEDGAVMSFFPDYSIAGKMCTD